jgi:UDP-N-acetylmuramoylalanine--D-glutamate ligase
MANYAAVKERLVAAAGVAIIGADDDYSASIASFLQAKGRKVVRIASSSKLAEGIWLDGRKLVKSEGRSVSTVIDLSTASALRGDHNGQNAAAAYAACSAAGLTDREIQAGFDSFPGLAHRMEQVSRTGRVLFVNDSKATNADAAEKALASFENIYWIAGGLPKAGGIEPLRPLFGRIARSYLIGQATEQFATVLADVMPVEQCGTLDKAVAAALRDAKLDGREDPVVLLSPACASFDQFPNFEIRGEAFVKAVAALPGVEMTIDGETHAART